MKAELFTAGQWVLVAGIEMQGIVYMDNRKGRKQARKDARRFRKLSGPESNGVRALEGK